MKKLLNQLMLCATLVFMSMSMSSCLTTMGLMLIWLDDDEPQQQQQAPVEKIQADNEGQRPAELYFVRPLGSNHWRRR